MDPDINDLLCDERREEGTGGRREVSDHIVNSINNLGVSLMEEKEAEVCDLEYMKERSKQIGNRGKR